MNDMMFLIIIALVGVAVGIAIGVIVASMRTDKKGSSASSLKSAGNMVEIVRILQDRKSGQPYPEVNGVIIRFPADLPNSQRTRLADIFRLLLGWISPTEATSAPAAPPAKPTAPAEATADIVSLPKDAPSQAARISPIDMVARAVQSDTRIPSAHTKSIAAQIDEILQEKLVESHLENQGVRLMELPSKGLVVMVGLKQYAEVGDVPDEAIRNLIRASVAEWEKRSAET